MIHLPRLRPTGFEAAEGSGTFAQPPASLAHRLRVETDDVHRAAKRAFDLDRRLASLAGYGNALEALNAFVIASAPLLGALAPVLPVALRDAPARRRLRLGDDLARLGRVASAPLGDRDHTRTKVDLDHALGAWYVHEGSALGGLVEQRIIDGLPREGPCAVTDRLHSALADLAPPTRLCGALAMELPRGVGHHIVCYRREWRHEVTWGGDPSESLAPDMTSRDAKDLSPRRSFEAWSQAVTGRSRPWRPVQVEAAADLVGALAGTWSPRCATSSRTSPCTTRSRVCPTARC